jgi:hypothetical protein
MALCISRCLDALSAIIKIPTASKMPSIAAAMTSEVQAGGLLTHFKQIGDARVSQGR